MEIGKQIKKYRIEKGLSQEELAEKIFVSRQTISNSETNKNYPDIKSLLLLSYIFDVSLDILFKGDIEKMREKVKTEEIEIFKNEANVFNMLMIITILSLVSLTKFLSYISFAIWLIIAFALGYIFY